jgi:acetyl-CoA carboxylase carboxyl transferase subunit beta
MSARIFKRLLGTKTRTSAIGDLDERFYVSHRHACPACQEPVEMEELRRSLFVCPHCGHHFRISAIERLSFFADGGRFEETGIDVEVTNPLDFPGYDDKIVSTRQASQLDEAISTGLISLEGRDVLVGVMSFQFLGGSMGSVVGERVARLMLEGARRKLPVVLFTASGGARMHEGIFSLMQMAKTSHAAAQLDAAKQLLILVLTDPTTGGVTASFAMLGDVIIAEPGALIGFAGPRVIEGTIKQKLPPGFQRAEFLLEKGFVDMVVPRGDLRSTIGFLIDSSAGGAR